MKAALGTVLALKHDESVVEALIVDIQSYPTKQRRRHGCPPHEGQLMGCEVREDQQPKIPVPVRAKALAIGAHDWLVALPRLVGHLELSGPGGGANIRPLPCTRVVSTRVASQAA
jgi:hypothetical protein